MSKVLIVLIIIAVVIGFIILGPYLTILAISTLTGAVIPFTFKTWLATVWIHIVFAGGAIASKA
jgi:hypothetical protein